METAPNPYEDEDEEDLEELGTPVYQGTGLSVWALTAEELQRFLDAHQSQPAQLPGSGWAALDPPRHPLGGPRTPPAPTAAVPAEPVVGSLGSPSRSALAAYRRRRAEELAGWTRSLVWRAPLVAAGGRRPGPHRPGRPALRRADRAGGGGPGRVAAAVSALRAGPRLAARRRRRTAHRPPAGPPGPRRVRGLPRPGRTRLAGQRGPPRHRSHRRVRDRQQAVDRHRPPRRRRAGLAQPHPAGSHP
jgi:hypothetical protein